MTMWLKGCADKAMQYVVYTSVRDFTLKCEYLLEDWGSTPPILDIFLLLMYQCDTPIPYGANGDNNRTASRLLEEDVGMLAVEINPGSWMQYVHQIIKEWNGSHDTNQGQALSSLRFCTDSEEIMFRKGVSGSHYGV
ncbi:hypothetical protein L210DRAFT_3504520 [Boletus edulis BED1]|uniref:Uncharacterized protein n=1 Tax=Boletus edulis BED1 TaxID=1328754 RepID=A0AAD4BU30_BOLED|nr:hypothetical protein L210DRAFT_3504520 [Boletus edulis BED1]